MIEKISAVLNVPCVFALYLMAFHTAKEKRFTVCRMNVKAGKFLLEKHKVN